MPKILITGGVGNVGSHTVKALAADGHTCVVFDNLSTGHEGFVHGGPLVKGDIRDGEAINAAMAEHKIDDLVHFSALSDVGASFEDPAQCYVVNVNGTRVLLDCMVKRNIQNIVFSSSYAVYGQQTCTSRPTKESPRSLRLYQAGLRADDGRL